MAAKKRDYGTGELYLDTKRRASDVLVAVEDQEEAFERLWQLDAHPDGVEAAPGDVERRERWTVGGGQLTRRTAAWGVQVAELLDRARLVGMTGDGVGVVRVALVEDLLDVAVASPWSEDLAFLPGLRAVLASERYSTRRSCRMSDVEARHRALLQTLVDHDVRFVLVGGVALQLHGCSGRPSTWT
ncbi:hypothetical protein [Baekduia sp. Peel2402]|uniref:hypothetical protein n=1 Tax=Baekduia sp. Peel2402 TaxID=3458296 RepID=UPI00403E5CD6